MDPPLARGTIIGLIAEAPDAPINRVEVSGEKIQNHRQKGNVNAAKHMLSQILII
jgi:hypothetical protein